MSTVSCLLGGAALSSFRKNKLLETLRTSGVECASLSARWCYLVEHEAPLSSPEKRLVEQLLEAKLTGSLEQNGLHLVTPRLGTISPWSSKATEIFRGCGLDAVMRVERATATWIVAPPADNDAIHACLHDRMTQSVLPDLDAATRLFDHHPPRPLQRISVSENGSAALQEADRDLGLALSEDEIQYLVDSYNNLGRDPTDAELMMFAQANSEHCRHKIFNASWTLNGTRRDETLFGMIRNTHASSPRGVLSAYHDNSAVLAGFDASRFFSDPKTNEYRYEDEPVAMQIKVETHNHPTAISPFPGAATGSGGEIRDEAATGRGAKPKAGLTGFSVSNLHIPGLDNSWACESGKPGRIASALDIMIEGPIGAASFNNEFGRPALGGYFRTFEQNIDGRLWGYHKPIMVAGGMGNIRPQHVEKHELQPGDAVFVLGGPAMLIGLGGGAASSLGSGQSDLQLDFASVQRGNPEMQRRCQEVIDSCWAMDDQNPLVSIHDVGAGGLSNALPELLNDSQRGGVLELRRVPSTDTAMSPMEIWCNEAQERYVMAVRPDQVDYFLAICERERCPVALLGYATEDRKLRLEDELLGDAPVDVPMELILGKAPKMHREAHAVPVSVGPVDDQDEALEALVSEVLGHPAVGSKSFLITIGDRTVGGLVARDQMVGPWQVPVADAAVTLSGFEHFSGECMAIGERAPLAVVDGPASGRMAVGEAITNIASAPLAKLSDVRLSANWMAAAGEPGQDAVLFETVYAVGMELCPELGIAIPVGKDSMSLKTRWHRDDDPANEQISMIAPVSLVVSAFAPVADVRHSLTPQLRLNRGPSRLLLLDLGQGKNRLGGSIYAQLGQSFGDDVPDLDEAHQLKAFFSVIQRLNREGLLLAYHDRSDGGLIASLSEMAFAGRCGLRLDFDLSRDNLPAALFAEELGAVIQVRVDDLKKVRAICRDEGIDALLQDIGQPQNGRQLLARCSGKPALDMDLSELQLKWAETSLAIQALRDNPECAEQEKSFLSSWEEPLLRPQVTFEVQAPEVLSGDRRPAVAILREQGVNGQVEMAAAFDMAGFRAVDVHMTDLIDGQTRLDSFQGFVACGGFSYGDVLGAGRGWASSILFRDALGEQFSAFLSKDNRFALGVCNGCQMLAALREIIPGSDSWPDFIRNRSEQFEARLSLVRIEASPSLFFEGMEGSLLPVASAHGEGRADFGAGAVTPGTVALRYVTASGETAQSYPQNPNGSPHGVTGLCNSDGRVTIMMPHPERTLRTANFSWAPAAWGARSPWQQMFNNARLWVG